MRQKFQTNTEQGRGKTRDPIDPAPRRTRLAAPGHVPRLSAAFSMYAQG